MEKSTGFEQVAGESTMLDAVQEEETLPKSLIKSPFTPINNSVARRSIQNNIINFHKNSPKSPNGQISFRDRSTNVFT